MSTNPDPNFYRVVQPNGAPMLCLGDRPLRPMPCGCVPADTSRRCVTGKKYRLLIRNTADPRERHTLMVALNEHLNGR